jgi:hypothetical protein
MRAIRILEDSVRYLAVQLPKPEDGPTEDVPERTHNPAEFEPSDTCTELCQTSLIGHIFGIIYWQRAWTVQEIFVARRLTFWADAILMELESILRIGALINAREESEIRTYVWNSGYRGFANEWFQFKRFHKIVELIHLLDGLHGKRCTNP